MLLFYSGADTVGAKIANFWRPRGLYGEDYARFCMATTLPDSLASSSVTVACCRSMTVARHVRGGRSGMLAAARPRSTNCTSGSDCRQHILPVGAGNSRAPSDVAAHAVRDSRRDGGSGASLVFLFLVSLAFPNSELFDTRSPIRGDVSFFQCQ